ncbi:hypothetical protein [Pseudomonas sp. MWU12-3103b]|uniref:hypothetical protein n=1 Tax=Pseudomonas sp. MWU12-3103b TaxID=2928857 RepID=UPI001FFEEB26|nr:hypothetical protein [Pseudomonas sp. MWU12-3103b]
MKFTILATTTLLIFFATPINAQQAAIKETDALDMIRKMAVDFCVEAQTAGSNHQAELKGSIDAKLGALVKKLGDAKIGLAADYSQESHVGVLRHQVLDAIKETNSCKRHVFDELVNRLLPVSSARNSSTTENSKKYGSSPQDAYLIATHPTKIQLRE